MNRKGFTIVEFVILIIIIGILSVVIVPIIHHYNEEKQNTYKRNNLFNKEVISEGMYYYDSNAKHCKVKMFSNVNDFDLESDINRFCEGKTVIDIKINSDEKAIHATIIYKEK